MTVIDKQGHCRHDLISLEMNIGGPFLGLLEIVAALFTADAKYIGVARIWIHMIFYDLILLETNIGGPFLGLLEIVAAFFTADAKNIGVARSAKRLKSVLILHLNEREEMRRRY
ncbi:hypothetical protein Tco_1534604 [Tanacetum coccineum]